MNRVLIVVLSLVAAAAVGWLAFDRLGSSQAVAWRDVTASLPRLRPTHPAVLVFESTEELRGYAERPLAFDFGTERILLVAAGARSSTGYAVVILDVRDERRRVVVRVRELTPELGDRVRPGVTYPYRLVALPASDKPVTVRWAGRGPDGIG